MPTMNSAHSAHTSPAGHQRVRAGRAPGVTGTARPSVRSLPPASHLPDRGSHASLAGLRLGTVTDSRLGVESPASPKVQVTVGPDLGLESRRGLGGRSRIAAYGGEAEDPVCAERRRASRLPGCRTRSVGPAPHRHLGASRRGSMGCPRLRAIAATAELVGSADPLRPPRHRTLGPGPARSAPRPPDPGGRRRRRAQGSAVRSRRRDRPERRHDRRGAARSGPSGAVPLAGAVHLDERPHPGRWPADGVDRGSARNAPGQRGDRRERGAVPRAQPGGRRALRPAARAAPTLLGPAQSLGALLPSDDEGRRRRRLPLIRTPTLVLNRTGNPIVPVEQSRVAAAAIKGAKFVELPGTDHLAFSEGIDSLVDELEEFLTGTRTGADPDRMLTTLLFTDIVNSTTLAAQLGDRRWRDLLDQHHQLGRGELARFGGREVATTGDGFFASFDRPIAAVRCALAMVEAMGSLPLQIRAGVHTGEVEVREADLGGWPSTSRPGSRPWPATVRCWSPAR